MRLEGKSCNVKLESFESNAKKQRTLQETEVVQVNL